MIESAVGPENDVELSQAGHEGMSSIESSGWGPKSVESLEQLCHFTRHLMMVMVSDLPFLVCVELCIFLSVNNLCPSSFYLFVQKLCIVLSVHNICPSFYATSYQIPQFKVRYVSEHAIHSFQWSTVWIILWTYSWEDSMVVSTWLQCSICLQHIYCIYPNFKAIALFQLIVHAKQWFYQHLETGNTWGTAI